MPIAFDESAPRSEQLCLLTSRLVGLICGEITANNIVCAWDTWARLHFMEIMIMGFDTQTVSIPSSVCIVEGFPADCCNGSVANLVSGFRLSVMDKEGVIKKHSLINTLDWEDQVNAIRFCQKMNEVADNPAVLFTLER